MSGWQPSAHPPPPVFGDADARDSDTYGLDCRMNMALRGDYITGASLVAVTRRDNIAISGGDLSVTGVGVVPAGTTIYLPTGPVVATLGMFVSWVASGGIPGVTYLVTIALILASSGRPINRTVVIGVLPYVG